MLARDKGFEATYRCCPFWPFTSGSCALPIIPRLSLTTDQLFGKSLISDHSFVNCIKLDIKLIRKVAQNDYWVTNELNSGLSNWIKFKFAFDVKLQRIESNKWSIRTTFATHPRTHSRSDPIRLMPVWHSIARNQCETRMTKIFRCNQWLRSQCGFCLNCWFGEWSKLVDSDLRFRADVAVLLSTLSTVGSDARLRSNA